MGHSKALFDYEEDPVQRMVRLVPYTAKVLHQLVTEKLKDKPKWTKDTKTMMDKMSLDEPFTYIVGSLCALLGEKYFVRTAPVSKMSPRHFVRNTLYNLQF